MTWSFTWRGKVQDYDPSVVQAGGPLAQERDHAQAMARAVFDAIAEWTPEQLLLVTAWGDAGHCALNIDAQTPTPVDDQLAAQQPVSVLSSDVPTGNPAADTSQSASAPVGDPSAAPGSADAQAAPSDPPVDSSPPASGTAG